MPDIVYGSAERSNLELAAQSLWFDAEAMERFWVLERDFLASLGNSDAAMSRRRNRLLLSAVLFGGLLNPAGWQAWLQAVMGKLRRLPSGGCLSPSEARSVFITAINRMWFADPITACLLAQPVAREDTGGDGNLTRRANDGDLGALLNMPEGSLILALKQWVLPAATIKMALQWPPLVVEYCIGAVSSKSLGRERWQEIYRQEIQPSERLSPVALLDPIRSVRPKREAKADKPFQLTDRGFYFIKSAIFGAMQVYATSEDPTLELERAALQEKLTACQKDFEYYSTTQSRYDRPASDALGWHIHDWFLRYCPSDPSPKGTKPKKPPRASTLYDYVFVLGQRVDWSELWQTPLDLIDEATMRAKLNEVCRARPDSFWIARKLYGFLGYGKLPRPEALKTREQQSSGKSQVITGPEYQAILAQLLSTSGERGAHWLGTVLMFRCGIRTRELIAMEIDHITVIGDNVELTIAATPYVALKNETSARVLPLHALLTADELTTLLSWRAYRVRECHHARRHARLLFATVYDPSDYDYLFDPIEVAIRRALGTPVPTPEECKSAAYVFSRCSVLRHSFVSYGMATLLLPLDDGGFALPAAVTPDLVSLARRKRLERALLAEDHLGLSSVEALRQLTGHARYTRTLATYTHLMDLVVGAHSWRRSSEPSLPAAVVSDLARGDPKPESLIRTASAATRREEEAIGAAVISLRDDNEVAHLLPARERRPRGKSVPDWTPAGNTFLSQLRPPVASPIEEMAYPLPEWRTNDVGDWRTADLIVQMASRGISAQVIADEVGVTVEAIVRLTSRFYRLLSVRRMSVKGRVGGLRHQILLEDEANGEPLLGPFLKEDACWYGPLRPLPARRHDRLESIWQRLQEIRQDDEHLSRLRHYICAHQNGRMQLKNRGRLAGVAQALNLALAGAASYENRFHQRSYALKEREQVYVHEIDIRQQWEKPFEGFKSADLEKQRRLQPNQQIDRSARLKWPFGRVLLYLMLLSEALSLQELLPELVLSKVSVKLQDADTTTKIDDAIAKAKCEREKRADADRKAKEAETLRMEKAIRDARNAEKHRARMAERSRKRELGKPYQPDVPRKPEDRKPILSIGRPRDPTESD